jgi:hypothetical protein
MGCPVHFSTSGGMGSALLRKPEVVADILTTLVRNLPCPVTCKIRLLGACALTWATLRVSSVRSMAVLVLCVCVSPPAHACAVTHAVLSRVRHGG